jgi:hypothetical protein
MKGLLTLVGCAVAAAVAAEVSVPAARSAVARPASFCTSIGSIEQADIARHGSAPGGPGVFVIPAHVVIRDRAQARKLARMLCTLPRFPDNIHCPIDASLRYEITYTGVGGGASVDPFGCETVSGAGPLRWAARSPGFWRALGAMLGRPNATVDTFRGRE